MTKNRKVVNEQMRKYNKCLEERSGQAGESKPYLGVHSKGITAKRRDYLPEAQKAERFKKTKFDELRLWKERRTNAKHIYTTTTIPCHPPNP